MRLRTHHARHPVDEAHVQAHLEALVEGINVAQVASRNDDPVRHLPVKLLANLNGCSLLALKPQTAQCTTGLKISNLTDMLSTRQCMCAYLGEHDTVANSSQPNS